MGLTKSVRTAILLSIPKPDKNNRITMTGRVSHSEVKREGAP